MNYSNNNGNDDDSNSNKAVLLAMMIGCNGNSLVTTQDLDGNAMYVGLSHPGIKTFQGNKKANCFSW